MSIESAVSTPQDAHRELIGRLRQHGDDVRRLTRDLDDATLSTRRSPDKWSLKELVCHLMSVQQLFDERLDSVLTEDSPAIGKYSPESDTRFDELVTRPAHAVVDGFLAERTRFVSRLEALTSAEWHRRGRHPEFIDYDVHFQIEYMMHHEGHHLYQMYLLRFPRGKIPPHL
jgi:hypothetical protein